MELSVMQFFASISLDLVRRSEVERALPAETARVRELVQSGQIHALYLPEGTGAPDSLWAVFSGDSRESVERVLESLPLYPYMRIELTQLRSLELVRL
jgi:muconolactone delta-isomerase